MECYQAVLRTILHNFRCDTDFHLCRMDIILENKHIIRGTKMLENVNVHMELTLPIGRKRLIHDNITF